MPADRTDPIIMASDRFAALYDPVLADVERNAAVADRFIDTDLYRIYLAALWSTAVSRPEQMDLDAGELEPFYDYLNERAREVLGGSEPVLASFRYLLSTEGEQAMTRARVPKHLRDFLLHFAGLMLDPDGLQRRVRAARGTD
jgi:hypothetical protein